MEWINTLMACVYTGEAVKQDIESIGRLIARDSFTEIDANRVVKLVKECSISRLDGIELQEMQEFMKDVFGLEVEL